MSMLQDKSVRRYLVFLMLFCIVLSFLSFFFTWFQGIQTKAALLEWERTTASSLLEQGIPDHMIATAFRSLEISEEGMTLLQKIGHTDTTAHWLLSSSRQAMLQSAGSYAIILLALAFLLMGGSLCFLFGRERMYQRALQVVTRYGDGVFSDRLPGGDSGTLCHFFGAVDKLATALQSKSEAEAQGRIFLKDTISDISHQLKTPLAALELYMEIITAEPDHPDTVSEFAQKSVKSLERMEHLIQSLLKMTRLDAGSVLFESHPCPVMQLVEQATADLRTRADQENKHLYLEGDPDEILDCDLDWTAEAIGNLVKNALDHTGPGGTIRVSWYRSPAMLRLTVADDGCGISQEDIHHIFKRFYRSRHASDSRGIGLGLPLAKSIVESQGGMLSVQSVPGSGTVFTLSFLSVGV